MNEENKVYVLSVQVEADDSYYADYLYVVGVYSTFDKAKNAETAYSSDLHKHGKIQVDIHTIDDYEFHGFRIDEYILE